MGVVTTTIYASEALLPMSFCSMGLRVIYVPFVCPTEAGNTVRDASTSACPA